MRRVNKINCNSFQNNYSTKPGKTDELRSSQLIFYKLLLDVTRSYLQYKSILIRNKFIFPKKSILENILASSGNHFVWRSHRKRLRKKTAFNRVLSSSLNLIHSLSCVVQELEKLHNLGTRLINRIISNQSREHPIILSVLNSVNKWAYSSWLCNPRSKARVFNKLGTKLLSRSSEYITARLWISREQGKGLE